MKPVGRTGEEETTPLPRQGALGGGEARHGGAPPAGLWAASRCLLAAPGRGRRASRPAAGRLSWLGRAAAPSAGGGSYGGAAPPGPRCTPAAGCRRRRYGPSASPAAASAPRLVLILLFFSSSLSAAARHAGLPVPRGVPRRGRCEYGQCRGSLPACGGRRARARGQPLSPAPWVLRGARRPPRGGWRLLGVRGFVRLRPLAAWRAPLEGSRVLRSAGCGGCRGVVESGVWGPRAGACGRVPRVRGGRRRPGRAAAGWAGG